VGVVEASAPDYPNRFRDAFSATLEKPQQMPESTWLQRAQSGADGRESFCTHAIHDDKRVGIAVGLPGTENQEMGFVPYKGIP
jgi:hypothetical protein